MAEHRALQILKAMQQRLIAADTHAGANVYLGVTDQIGEERIELSPGPDVPIALDNLAYESLHRIYVDLFTRGIEHEQNIVEQLYALRAQSHVALMADETLGLSFVISIRYQGTEDFGPDFSGDRLGAMRTLFDVAYRLSYRDPTQ